jgi:hypothetical protein
MRVVRVALEALDLDPHALRHGIVRSVYAMPLATNTREFLSGKDAELTLDRPALSAVAEAARNRWLIPRAERVPDFEAFTRNDLLALLGDSLRPPLG